LGALATVVVGAFFFAWRGPGVGIVNKRGGLRVANVEGQALPQSKRRGHFEAQGKQAPPLQR
jgi:hypothetical protein